MIELLEELYSDCLDSEPETVSVILLKTLTELGVDEYELSTALNVDESRLEEIIFYGEPIKAKEFMVMKPKLKKFLKSKLSSERREY